MILWIDRVSSLGSYANEILLSRKVLSDKRLLDDRLLEKNLLTLFQ